MTKMCKKMMLKALSIGLAVAMIGGIIPISAFAAEVTTELSFDTSASVDEQAYAWDATSKTLTIKEDLTITNLTGNGIALPEGGTIVLDANLTINADYGINADALVTIQGAKNLTIHAGTVGIISGTDVQIGATSGTIAIDGFYGIYAASGHIGVSNVTGAIQIKANAYGIVAQDVAIADIPGTIDITITDDSAPSAFSGIYATTSDVVISNVTGALTIHSKTFGIYANENVTITGTTADINGAYAGIYAWNKLSIGSSTLTATATNVIAYATLYGFFGVNVTNDSTVHLTSNRTTICVPNNGPIDLSGASYLKMVADEGNPIAGVATWPAGAYWRDSEIADRFSTDPIPDISATTFFELSSTARYLVLYKSDGAISKSASYKENETVTMIPSPTKENATFTGWESADITFTGDSFPMPAHNVTFTAKWLAGINYPLSYDFNGGVGTVPDVTYYLENAEVTLVDPPIRSGYTFKGWKANSGAVLATDASIYEMPATAVTLTAQWEANTYTLSFDLNEGVGTADSMTVTYGQKIGTLPTPTRDGYDFDGWVIDGFSITAESTWARLSNQTAIALWSSNTVSISFDTMGGDPTPEPITLTKGSALSPLPQITKNGYRFAGWSTEQNNGTILTETDVFNENATLYAQWRILEPEYIWFGEYPQSYVGSGYMRYENGGYEIDYAGPEKVKAFVTSPPKLPGETTGGNGHSGYYAYEPIKWVILHTQKNADNTTTYRLMAQDILAAHEYDDTSSGGLWGESGSLWADSTIRTWLNADVAWDDHTSTQFHQAYPYFYGTAFGDFEKLFLIKQQTSNTNVSKNGNAQTTMTVSGESDFVSLLTLAEFNSLTDPLKTALNSAYTDQHGLSVHFNVDSWALHTVSESTHKNYSAGTIKQDGTLAYVNATAQDLGIRPVVTITIPETYCLRNAGTSGDPYTIEKRYTLSYDLADGTGSVPSTTYYKVGESVPVTTASVTRAGYIFTGWLSDENVLYTAGDTLTMPAKDTILTAQWSEDKNGNGTIDATEAHYIVIHTDSSGNETYFKNQKDTVLNGLPTPKFNESPTREGYTFAGWSPTKADTVTANVTYTATWVKNSAPVIPTPAPETAGSPVHTNPQTGIFVD